MLKSWITFLLSILTFQSCGFRHLKEGNNYENRESSDQSSMMTSVYYSTIEKKIIIPKCLSCHSDSGGNQGGVNLETYKETIRHISDINLKSLIEKSMPPKYPLNSYETSLLGNWISKGAPLDIDNSGPSNNQGTIEKISIKWPKIKKEIINNHCIQCHSPPTIDPSNETISTMEAGLDLTDLSVVKEKAELIFKRIVILNDMPLRPYPPLSIYEKKLFSEWIISGMLDEVNN